MTRARLIGSAVKRVEDPRLITGAGTYIGDLSPTGMLHAEFVRSQYAHARLNSVDTTAAQAMPGVVAVFTGADVNNKINPLPGHSSIDGAKNPKRTILADGATRAQSTQALAWKRTRRRSLRGVDRRIPLYRLDLPA